MYNLNYFNIIHEISLFNVSNFNGLSYYKIKVIQNAKRYDIIASISAVYV